MGCGEDGNPGFGEVRRGRKVTRGLGFPWEMEESVTPRRAASSSPLVPEGSLQEIGAWGSPWGLGHESAGRRLEHPPWGRAPAPGARGSPLA